MPDSHHARTETRRASARQLREQFDGKLQAITEDDRDRLRSELRQFGPTLRFNETLWIIYYNRSAMVGYDVTSAALKLPATFVEACRVALGMPEL